MSSPRYSSEFQICFMMAFKVAQDNRHEYVMLEHVLFSLLHDQEIGQVITSCGADVKKLKKKLKRYFERDVEAVSTEGDYLPEESLAVQRVISRAANQVINSGREIIECADVLVALFSEEESHAVYFLYEQEVNRFDVISYISHGDTSEFDFDAFDDDEDDEDIFGENEESKQDKGRQFLAEFSVNLTERAKEGKIDEVIGRDKEMHRMVQVLSRRSKNNPVLVGDPGVGKTAIVEGLALKISRGDVPEKLKECEVFALDMGSVVAGTKFRGEFEERLKNIVVALKHIPNALLFIDEIHSIMGAGSTSGGSMDAANLLKPALTRGDLRCIGSTTYEEYKTHILKDHAFARRFQKVDVVEPSIEDTLAILKGVKKYYEEHHEVTYSPAVLKATVQLSSRFIQDRALPDKAIDVLDETGASLSLLPKKRKTVRVADIEKTVASICMLPSVSLNDNDKNKLVHLEEELRKVVYGQDTAIAAVAKSVKMARAGLRDEDKTYGSFLFVGPTGVGKTELSKQLASIMDVKFLRFDMSEYQEKHSVSRLIGAPPGYVGFEQGGLLTDAVTKTPHAVILLDEIEKAHSDIYNILLQIMDNGTLTDSNGREANFRNVILIMTSNAGARDMASKLIGFENTENVGAVQKAVEKKFSPELRNRLDGIVYFDALSQDLMVKVVDKFIAKLEKQLKKKSIFFKLSPAAREWLAKKGYEPAFGARPLARLIDRQIKDQLTEKLLNDELHAGQFVLVEKKARKDELIVKIKELNELA